MAMPWSHDPWVQTLRLTYNAAVGAHAACARAITDATIRGEIPSAQLLESENTARLRLDEARAKLHAAMATALAGANAEPLRCVYVLSATLGYRCSLPTGHDGNNLVESTGPKPVSEDVIQPG